MQILVFANLVTQNKTFLDFMNITVIPLPNTEKLVLYKHEYRKFIDIKSRGGGSIFLTSLIKNNN